jgi:signal transduction histidine kinase
MAALFPNFIVGIGGSAGALNAYKALLGALPSDTGMAFVIVFHIHPTANSQLAQILSRHTKMPVMLAANAMPIQANHVYVIPANADLTIEGYTLKVVSPRTRRNVQVDSFLTSLADAMEAQAIGIILSGFDGDGTEGCKHIKAKGGKTFAQDTSAEVGEMPLHAQASGYVDFVLPPEQMPDELIKIGARFVRDKSLETNWRSTDDYFDQKNKTIEEEIDGTVRFNRLAADRERDSERAKTDFEQLAHRLSLTDGPSSRLNDSGLNQERKRSDEAQNAQREAEDRAHLSERFQKRLIAAALVENERSEANAIRLEERVHADLASEQNVRLLSEERISHNVTQAALVSRDLFLQAVSHDLRNPLGVISLGTSLMRRNLSSGNNDVGSLYQSLDTIERNTANMDRMISDLLDVERMVNGKLTLKLGKYDICAILRECKELFAPVLANKSISMTIQTGLEPIFADVDHDRILQVLSNLIGNALKFTPTGGDVRLSARKQAT